MMDWCDSPVVRNFIWDPQGVLQELESVRKRTGKCNNEMGSMIVILRQLKCETIKKRRICSFNLILCVPSIIFQLCRDGSSWVESVIS